MGVRYRAKYVTVNPDNPSARGICDVSGLCFNHEDLVPQMDWVGDRYMQVGNKLVGKPFEDKPQEQNRPPLVKRDPIPVKNPRLPSYYIDPNSNQSLPTDEIIDQLNTVKWGS